MSGQKALAALAAGLLALLVGGCDTFDYFQHSDRINYRAGDAVKANLERETIDPSHGAMYKTGGLGKTGSAAPPAPSTPTITPPTGPATGSP